MDQLVRKLSSQSTWSPWGCKSRAWWGLTSLSPGSPGEVPPGETLGPTARSHLAAPWLKFDKWVSRSAVLASQCVFFSPFLLGSPVYRGFWAVLMLLGVVTVVTASFLIICAAPFASHLLYKAGGSFYVAAGTYRATGVLSSRGFSHLIVFPIESVRSQASSLRNAVIFTYNRSEC